MRGGVKRPGPKRNGGNEPPEAHYHWKPDEDLSKGAQRIVGEQLECAIWQLAENRALLDDAVHDSRKAVKKIRSAMRLIQTILGRKYDEENAALRKIGRSLSPLRDAQALIEIFDDLDSKYRERLGAGSLIVMRA